MEGAELGTAYVRCDGLEGLFGGKAGVVAALLQAVPADLLPRVGMATAKFPAFVAARTSRPLEATTAPDDVQAFLAPQPIDLLPVPPHVKHELHRFGLHTLGAVAALGEPLLAERLGPEGKQAWAFCNGTDDRPVVPLAVEEVIVEHTALPFHSAASETLGVVVDTLLCRAYARPELHGRCAGAADLRCAADGGPPWELRIQFKQPIGTWERASFAIRSRLAVDHPRIPVEEVTLMLSRITVRSVPACRMRGSPPSTTPPLIGRCRSSGPTTTSTSSPRPSWRSSSPIARRPWPTRSGWRSAAPSTSAPISATRSRHQPCRRGTRPSATCDSSATKRPRGATAAPCRSAWRRACEKNSP